MKQLALLSALIFAMLTSVSAQAADTTELKVKGTIRPAACTPVIGGAGLIDYGNIPVASLTRGAFTKLAAKDVPFSLNCDAATKVAMKITDNQGSTKLTGLVSTFATTSESNIFGLGTVSDKSVGGYVVSLKQGSFTADTASVDTLVSSDNGTSWVKGTNGLFYSDRILSFGAAGSKTTGSYKTMSGTLSVIAAINKPEELPLTQDVLLNGSATIEVIYM